MDLLFALGILIILAVTGGLWFSLGAIVTMIPTALVAYYVFGMLIVGISCGQNPRLPSWLASTVMCAVTVAINAGVWLAYHLADFPAHPEVGFTMANMFSVAGFIGCHYGTKLNKNDMEPDLDSRFIACSSWRRAILWVSYVGESALRMGFYAIVGFIALKLWVSNDPLIAKIGMISVIGWAAIFAVWFMAWGYKQYLLSL